MNQRAEFKHISVLKLPNEINVLTGLVCFRLIQELFFQLSRDRSRNVKYTLTESSKLYSLCMQIPSGLSFSSGSPCVRFEILMPFLQTMEYKALL